MTNKTTSDFNVSAELADCILSFSITPDEFKHRGDEYYMASWGGEWLKEDGEAGIPFKNPIIVYGAHLRHFKSEEFGTAVDSNPTLRKKFIDAGIAYEPYKPELLDNARPLIFDLDALEAKAGITRAEILGPR